MKKLQPVLVGFLCGCLVILPGCSSIICGSSKVVNISSSPSGAKYRIVNIKKRIVVLSGTTPNNVTLKRGRGYFQAGDYIVVLEKPGYKKVIAPIEQGLETGWYLFGNAIFGGAIGWLIVDPLTGAMWTIKDLNVTMQSVTASSVPSNSTLRVVTLDEVPEHLRSKMVRIN